MKLYDRIMLYGVKIPWTPEESEAFHTERLRDHMRQAVPVDINNVAQYYHHTTVSGKRWSVADDMPHVVSPWPEAWLEFQAPVEPNGKADVGVMSFADRNDAGGWEAQMSVYVKLPDMRFVGHMGTIIAPINEQGRREGEAEFHMPNSDTPMQTMIEYVSTLVAPVYLAFSFSHCKNVTTLDHRPPAKVAAKRRRRGKPVGVTYKTLVIDGMTDALRTEGDVDKNGLKKALHICRGHFATYTEDKPLFGRVTGTFWKPMHTRGNKKRGEVRKDYAVKAPKEEAS